MEDSILKIEGLTKCYRKGKPVLENLDLELPKGKIIGLLGPNGCGKSTLLKLISGILVADSGSISICGIPRSEDTNSLISFLPERPYFNGRMKISSLLAFFEDFYADFDKVKALNMLHDLHINENDQLKSLSKGTKEKVQLILVMSRNARLYMLDEPIGGVDPASRDYILNTIISNYDPQASVIITTHLISDIEAVLDEFFFLDHGGRILLSGDAESVREEHGKTLDELFREVFKCSRNV